MASILTRVGAFLRGQQPEKRATIYTPAAGWAISPGGPRVNALAAENLSAVAACVGAISGTIATLPARVYRSAADGAGRVEVTNHPVARLIASPNSYQSWPDFLEWLVSQVLLHGNALAVIDWDGAGRPIRLTPVPWGFIQPSVLSSGRLVFDVVAYQTPFGGAGTPRRIFADEALFLRDRSDDGWLGRSRLSRSAAVVQAAAGLQEYSTSVWQNQCTPKGAITLPPKISAEGIQRMGAWMDEKYIGAHNGGKPLILDNGSTYAPISVSPEDSEVLASRQFTVVELCRLFNVPPPIVQAYENNTFTNAQQAGLWFAQNTLSPWCRKIEAEFARVLFSGSDAHLEIDLSGLMRGDYAARWVANVSAVNAGILTANEVREAEGYNPIAGGDVLQRANVAAPAPVKESVS